jgi:hypothetical protein
MVLRAETLCLMRGAAKHNHVKRARYNGIQLQIIHGEAQIPWIRTQKHLATSEFKLHYDMLRFFFR